MTRFLKRDMADDKCATLLRHVAHAQSAIGGAQFCWAPVRTKLQEVDAQLKHILSTVRVLELGAGTGDYSVQICNKWLPSECHGCIEYYASDYARDKTVFLQGLDASKVTNKSVKMMPPTFGIDANRIHEQMGMTFNLIISVNPFCYGLMRAPAATTAAGTRKVPWSTYCLNIPFLQSVHKSLKLGGALVMIAYTSLHLQRLFHDMDAAYDYNDIERLANDDLKQAKERVRILNLQAKSRTAFAEPRKVNRYATVKYADLHTIANKKFDVEVRSSVPVLTQIAQNRPDTRKVKQKVSGANTMIVLIKRSDPGTVRFV